MYFAQEHNAVTPVRLKSAAPRSRVKHSTHSYLPTSFWLNWVFQIFVLGIHLKANKQAMTPGLVSPDFLFTFGFNFRKPTDKTAKSISDCYLRLISKFQRSYQVIYDSSNLQNSIKLSYETTLLFNCSGAFRPRFSILIVM